MGDAISMPLGWTIPSHPHQHLGVLLHILRYRTKCVRFNKGAIQLSCLSADCTNVATPFGYVVRVASWLPPFMCFVGCVEVVLACLTEVAIAHVILTMLNRLVCNVLARRTSCALIMIVVWFRPVALVAQRILDGRCVHVTQRWWCYGRKKRGPVHQASRDEIVPSSPECWYRDVVPSHAESGRVGVVFRKSTFSRHSLWDHPPPPSIASPHTRAPGKTPFLLHHRLKQSDATMALG
jgi:hypothetical protein